MPVPPSPASIPMPQFHWLFVKQSNINYTRVLSAVNKYSGHSLMTRIGGRVRLATLILAQLRPFTPLVTLVINTHILVAHTSPIQPSEHGLLSGLLVNVVVDLTK